MGVSTKGARAGKLEQDRFKIKVVAVRSNGTNLKIRVNIMGDHPYAELIFRKVDAQGVKVFHSVDKLKKAIWE